MTTLTFPTLECGLPEEFEFSLVANTQVFSSPLSKAVQTIEMPGARWRLSFVLRYLEVADAARVRAFFAQLGGRAGRFYMHNLACPEVRGTAAGMPLVKGAGQSGRSLLIDGITHGTTLLAGDLFGVNGELKVVVADAVANAGHEMAVTFAPPLRASPPDNAPITLERPAATFMLDDDAMRVVTRAPVFSEISIAATEAWS